jgi:small-conductance mechanosensitive channel
VANTRLRLVRRLIFAVILLIGAMLALSQFEDVKRIATGLLASSAVLGLVVGFAARQTLANAIAGILLAITQPIRIGDLVTFEGESGTVEDVRLTYTFIRKANDTRLVVPNELLAQSTIENHTIVDPRVRVEVELWLPPSADASRALTVLSKQPDVDVEIAQVDKDGIKLMAATWADTARERGTVAARVRASSLESLRNEGLAFTPE